MALKSPIRLSRRQKLTVTGGVVVLLSLFLVAMTLTTSPAPGTQPPPTPRPHCSPNGPLFCHPPPPPPPTCEQLGDCQGGNNTTTSYLPPAVTLNVSNGSNPYFPGSPCEASNVSETCEVNYTTTLSHGQAPYESWVCLLNWTDRSPSCIVGTLLSNSSQGNVSGSFGFLPVGNYTASFGVVDHKNNLTSTAVDFNIIPFSGGSRGNNTTGPCGNDTESPGHGHGHGDVNGDLHSNCHTGSKGRGAGGDDKTRDGASGHNGRGKKQQHH